MAFVTSKTVARKIFRVYKSCALFVSARPRFSTACCNVANRHADRLKTTSWSTFDNSGYNKYKRTLTAFLSFNQPLSTSATTNTCVTVQASPSTSLMDEIVAIEVGGLKPKQPITLRSYFHDEDKQFESFAHYTSNDEGKVNTMHRPSTGGNFIGTEPMGLFWSMIACPGARHATRYIKRDVTKPLIVDISAHDTHLNEVQVREDTSPIGATSVERWYKPQDVELIQVNPGRVRGSLLKPKGSGPFPAIIDMFGGVLPGCNATRAALLASKGYVALSLEYFWAEEESQLIAVDSLELEYFEEAVDWLSSQPFVQPGGVATLGICKGGEMATAMAIHFPHKIRATVGISTCGLCSLFPTTYKGELFPCKHIPSPDEAALISGFSFDNICFKDFFKGEGAEYDSFQKFEKIMCPALIICGENDDCIPSQHSQKIAELITNNGHDNPCELVTYPGAGHLIEPPYAPICIFSYQPPWGIFRWGGTPRDHAHACEDAWKKLLTFLKEHMT